MREVCFLIGQDGRVVWSDAGRSPFWLDDSQARWQAIWSRRGDLFEVAHSHPRGPLGFSREDETTMKALEAALGRPLRFSVVSPHGMLLRLDGRDEWVRWEPKWARRLRRESGME